MSFQKNFQLGSKIFSSNIFYSPMCGYSDIAFRQLCKKYRPGLFFCEMVISEGLIRKNSTVLKLLEYENDMHPIGAQLCGEDPKSVKEAAKIIEELGFDLIDFNCGCPVNKVVKKGRGSAMLKTPDLIGEILSEIVDAVSIPVTVKIRTGWDEKNIIAPLVTKIAEKANAKGICIHGRTKEQGYSGKADWGIIKECKKVAKKIKVFANGDLFDAYAVQRCFAETGCDGVFIARGMIGKPWISEDIENLYNKGSFAINISRIKIDMIEHFFQILKYENEKKALIGMKKMIPWYLKGLIGTKELKIKMSLAKSTNELLEMVASCDWNNFRLIKNDDRD